MVLISVLNHDISSVPQDTLLDAALSRELREVDLLLSLCRSSGRGNAAAVQGVRHVEGDVGRGGRGRLVGTRGRAGGWRRGPFVLAFDIFFVMHALPGRLSGALQECSDCVIAENGLEVGRYIRHAYHIQGYIMRLSSSL